jgi:hypothetical protein
MVTFLLLASLVQGPGTVESLTAASDAVVHARVVRRSSAWSKGGGQIFTTVVLKPVETWKGDPGAEVTVVVPGGRVGDLSQTVHGMAAFQDGEEVVVFLHRRAPGLFGVERMALGKFSVTPQARAVRSRAELECVGCKPTEQDDLSLDELRARVLGSAAR